MMGGEEERGECRREGLTLCNQRSLPAVSSDHPLQNKSSVTTLFFPQPLARIPVRPQLESTVQLSYASDKSNHKMAYQSVQMYAAPLCATYGDVPIMYKMRQPASPLHYPQIQLMSSALLCSCTTEDKLFSSQTSKTLLTCFSDSPFTRSPLPGSPIWLAERCVPLSSPADLNGGTRRTGRTGRRRIPTVRRTTTVELWLIEAPTKTVCDWFVASTEEVVFQISVCLSAGHLKKQQQICVCKTLGQGTSD